MLIQVYPPSLNLSKCLILVGGSNDTVEKFQPLGRATRKCR